MELSTNASYVPTAREFGGSLPPLPATDLSYLWHVGANLIHGLIKNEV